MVAPNRPQPEPHDGLGLYNVTFFDGIHRRRDRRMWHNRNEMRLATGGFDGEVIEPDTQRQAQLNVMVNAISTLGLTPESLVWDWFVFRHLPLPPGQNIL